uniref:Protein kinase domain-containing protein n=1 Tax=Rhabditophanes sp. KR3021 TaxID=114890 RepID=A0AC35UA90_9BILA
MLELGYPKADSEMALKLVRYASVTKATDVINTAQRNTASTKETTFNSNGPTTFTSRININNPRQFAPPSPPISFNVNDEYSQNGYSNYSGSNGTSGYVSTSSAPRNSSTPQNVTPLMLSEYKRTHVHFPLAPPPFFNDSEKSRPLGTIISIQRENSDKTKPVTTPTSKLNPSSLFRTTFEKNHSQKMHISVSKGDGLRSNSFNVDTKKYVVPQSRLAYTSSIPPRASQPSNLVNKGGISSIMVNPDNDLLDLDKEIEKICRIQRLGSSMDEAKTTSFPENEAPQAIRCVSPLPESVATKIRNNTFESSIKPCKPGMFRFFMEQHIERLLQQYQERNQRVFQLLKEMEQADLADNLKKQMLKYLVQKESKYIRLKRQKMDVSMFDHIKWIGVGAFGKVSLVKKKGTDQIYAMKTLKKQDVINKQQAAHVKAERDILAEANSPWIVKLFFSFQDSSNLFFIMEYVPGGDMMQLLITKEIFEENLAKFYIAELTCALEYVHKLGFIHRDVKPDNILISASGHIKLTDFGLCTGLRWTHDKRHYMNADLEGSVPLHLRVDSFSLPQNEYPQSKLLEARYHSKRNQAHSVVGTSNYMAPEVIKRSGHTQLCDWWSVGVILYEMVIGRPPFMSRTEDAAETQHKIVYWKDYLVLHDPTNKLSSNCLSIIDKLCRDQENRLGIGGAAQVKQDPWFQSIDFNKLRNSQAPWIPKLEHAEDTSNFDDISFEDEIFGTDQPQTSQNPAFFEFTYRHFFDADSNTHTGQKQPHKRPPISNMPGILNYQNGMQSNQKSQLNQTTNTSILSHQSSRLTNNITTQDSNRQHLLPSSPQPKNNMLPQKTPPLSNPKQPPFSYPKPSQPISLKSMPPISAKNGFSLHHHQKIKINGGISRTSSSNRRLEHGIAEEDTNSDDEMIV